MLKLKKAWSVKIDIKFLLKINYHAIIDIIQFFSDFLRIVGKHLLKHQPIFDLSDINEVSEECRTHSKIFVESLENLNYWAMESK